MLPATSLPDSTDLVCGACGELGPEKAGSIPFYLSDCEIETPVYMCRSCGTYVRESDFDDPHIRSHFEVASYTSLMAENNIRAARADYFVYLASLVEARLGKPISSVHLLDVGSAYGHFLDQLKSRGASSEGVEIVPFLRDRMKQRGIVVHEQVPDSGEFDVITVVDSIYYTNEPLKMLLRMRALLRPGGIILIRVANRSWLLDLMRIVGTPIGRDSFGDAKFNFTQEGMLILMGRGGFSVDEVIWVEKGKKNPGGLMRLFYQFAPMASQILPRNISPGIILIGHPRA